jgi:hypothetical protein
MKELWQSPKCGQRFVTKNMSHSCMKFQLETLFAHSQPHVFQLYERFADLVQSVGPVSIIPQKTRVVFKVRTRFAGAVPRKSYLPVNFDFTRRHGGRRFSKIEQNGPHSFGHQVRIEKEEDFDTEFISLIREAYEVGEQKHLQRRHANLRS